MLGFAPEVTVAVQTGDRDVVAVAGFGLVELDVGFDVAESNAVDWLLCHGNVPFKTE